MMRRLRYLFLTLILSCLLIPGPKLRACTTAVISGKATPDGRPLLWKHRDTWAIQNKIVQFNDGKYTCMGLVNSKDTLNKSIWIGYNEMGFAIMNSASYNLNSDTLAQSGQEGRLMKIALQNCATVDDFQALLDSLKRPILLEANFGVIDAQNQAAYFELGNFNYTKFDANDPELAPDGYIIRTNHSLSGTPDVGGGYIRFLTASEVFSSALEANELTYQTIIQKASRNLTHGLTGTNLNQYAGLPGNTPKYVYFNDYIPRSGTSSSCIVQGIRKGEAQELTTMWSVVGFPLTSVVTPAWISQETELPEVVSYNETLRNSPLSYFSMQLKEDVYSFTKGSHASYYIDINQVINADGSGYVQLVTPFENELVHTYEQALEKWRRKNRIDQRELEKLYAQIDSQIFSFYEKNFGLKVPVEVLSQSGEKVGVRKVKKIRAGVYSGQGASSVCVLETMEAMKVDAGFTVEAISPTDIQLGKLEGLDVLIFPGGSGSLEYLSLGESNTGKVLDFAATEGKGIVGICAGGYLLATTEGYPSLEMLNTASYRQYYDRGRGLMGFQLTETGRKVFPELSEQDTLYVQFYDGPIFTMEGSTPLPLVTATITSDLSRKPNYPQGLTPGTPAFVQSDYGDGKIFVSVGHPEATAGMRWMVPRMAREVIGAPYISYPDAIVRPGINSREILFDSELAALEKSLRWQLYNDSEDIVLAALEELHQLRSRPSIRWAMGLLRNESPAIRAAATEYLRESEYTAAIPEIDAALLMEENLQVRENLGEALSELKSIIHLD